MTVFTQHAIRLFLLGLAANTLLVGCGDKGNDKVAEPVVRPAKIFHVTDPNGEVIRHFPAEVEANADSMLTFRVSGQIIEFPVKAGNHVSQGQLLARLDPKDYQLRLDERKARYELAQSQFERTKTLLQQKLASQSTFDEARANLSVAKSALDSAEADLDYTYLRAPFAGSIAKVLVEKHENVQAKQPVLMLQARDMIDISIQIPENIISRVDKDSTYQPTVVFDAHPEQEYLVSIKEWDTQADATTLTYKVVFSMPAPTSFNALPGMSANVRIDLSKVAHLNKNRYLLPVSAVFTGTDNPVVAKQGYVWKVDPNSMTVSKVAVTLGDIKNDGIEVLTGVAAGDAIVSAGVHYLKDGMQIREWTREKGL